MRMHNAKDPTPYMSHVNSLLQSYYEIMPDNVNMSFRRSASFIAYTDSAHNCNEFRPTLCKNYISKQFELTNKDSLNIMMNQRIKNDKRESIRKTREKKGLD